MAKLKENRTIIVSSESPDLFTTKRLLSESNKLKYTGVWLNPYQYLISINKKPKKTKATTGLYFHRTSGIRYDDFDLLVARHHEDNHFKITNPILSLETFRKKDEQTLFFKRHDIAAVDTMIYRGELNEKYWGKLLALSSNRKYILKMIRGNQGIGVNLIEGHQSLKSILETFHAMNDQKFLIQPYIEHKKEWRLFVIKNEIIGVIERTISSDDFRGNSKRSTGKFIKKIPSEMQRESLRAASLSGLDYCGIDVMETSKGFVFLEINPVPGFLQMEELSKINIARELITRLAKEDFQK